jgi:glycosyltransferase involved in cell wall biosynthesis
MATAIPGVAGPASFQRRFADGLASRGLAVRYGLDDVGGDALLVIGGTRSLRQLRRWRRSGIPIAQRLDGMNWIHRRRPTGLTHYLRAEFNNLLMRIVRGMADIVVYQSEFARAWWARVLGEAEGDEHVVLNGVPLRAYSPDGPEAPPTDRVRVLVVEGRFGGGYEVGLEWAVSLAERLARRLPKPVELVIAGAASDALRRACPPSVVWKGVVPPEAIPGLHRGAHMLFSTDLHPACPNSVLESMACGNPVVAFDTGAIAELVTDDSGVVVPYGSDPWRVQPPDIGGLAEAAAAVAANQQQYRPAARRRAEAAFGLDRMVDGYLAALGWGPNG